MKTLLRYSQNLERLNLLLFVVLTVIAIYWVKISYSSSFDALGYKVAMCVVSAILSFWIDRLLFPTVKQGDISDHLNKLTIQHLDADAEYEATDKEPIYKSLLTLLCVIMIRRALIFMAVCEGVTRGV